MAFSFASCDDFLTLESPDELTSDSFWRDKEDVESAMSAAYSQLYMTTTTNYPWDFPEVKWPVEAYREDIIDLGKDATNYQNWVELYDFSYTNGNSQFTIYWEAQYRGINFANEILDKVAEMSQQALPEADRKPLIAEAHFLRGFYTMQLLLNWKQIIIRDKYATSGESSVLDKPLSSREDAWNFVISDFKAAEGLPQKYDSENTGRATSGTVYSYLGYAYLTMASEQPEKKSEYLQNAIDAFDKVQGYELVSDFGSMFNGTNKNSKESIFEIQFSMSDANGALYRTQLHRWIGSSELGGWDEILPSKTLVDEFKKEGKTSLSGEYDARMYATLFFNDPYFNDGKGKVYGHDYDDLFVKENSSTRTVFRKLLPATKAALDLDYTDVNVPLMRYSNVLLMKAEALNDLGRTSEAIPLINEVRQVHGNMPPMNGTTQAEVQAQIEHEREIEFPLENFRWYDLRRWGNTAQALNAAGRRGFTDDNLFYPIPQKEINANGALKK